MRLETSDFDAFKYFIILFVYLCLPLLYLIWFKAVPNFSCMSVGLDVIGFPTDLKLQGKLSSQNTQDHCWWFVLSAVQLYCCSCHSHYPSLSSPCYPFTTSCTAPAWHLKWPYAILSLTTMEWLPSARSGERHFICICTPQRQMQHFVHARKAESAPMQVRQRGIRECNYYRSKGIVKGICSS